MTAIAWITTEISATENGTFCELHVVDGEEEHIPRMTLFHPASSKILKDHMAIARAEKALKQAGWAPVRSWTKNIHGYDTPVRKTR